MRATSLADEFAAIETALDLVRIELACVRLRLELKRFDPNRPNRACS